MRYSVLRSHCVCAGALAIGKAVALQIAIETGTADAENVRCAQPVAFAYVQDALDVNLADFFERQRLPLVGRTSAGRPLMLQVLGEVGEVDEIAGGRDACARNDVFEFADVARPCVLQ